MALFICQETNFWRNRLWKPGEKMSYPTEQVDQVPHHFERVDNEGAPGAQPQPQRVGSSAPAAPVAHGGYDQREVAAIVGMHHTKRAKLLAQLKLEIPGGATKEEVARLAIDAAKAQGIDPLPADVREKIAAEPVAPKVVNDEDAPAAPARMALGGERPISVSV